jgi:DNA-binding NarL/FixJ family response regulator
LPKSSIRVLIVEDFEPWRRFYCSTLQKQSGFQIIGEVSDGLEAVHEARQLQPDLILLDIGLPTLNGIEAARRIREVSPASKILFLSEHRSADIVGEALGTGVSGYVVKSDAASEFVPAVNAILEGMRFVSASLASHGFSGAPNQRTADHVHSDSVVTFVQPQISGITRHHEVGFYSEERHFLDQVTRFIATALKAGNSAIVVATESHRESLLVELQADGLDIGAATTEGRYIPLDAADTLSMFMVNGMPDPVRFLELLGDLIMTATEAAKGEDAGVSVFGECVYLLWEQGNIEAAIQMEKLGNKLTKIHAVDILCGYSLANGVSEMDSHTFERICAEHSVVHSF